MRYYTVLLSFVSMFIGMEFALPQDEQVDPVATPGCVANDTAKSFLEARNPSMILELRGRTIYVRNEKVSRKYFLIAYRGKESMRITFIGHDKENDPENVCPHFNHKFIGELKHPDKRDMQLTFGEELEGWDKEQALRACKSVGRSLYNIHEETIMKSFEDMDITYGRLTEWLNDRIGASKAERKAEREKTIREWGDGSAKCHWPKEQFRNTRSDEYHFIVQVIAKRVLKTEDELSLFSFAIKNQDDVERWRMYRTMPNGATFLEAYGEGIKMYEDAFQKWAN